MKFSNKKEDFAQMTETTALIISLGAIFFQIWVLFSAVEFYFKSQYGNLLPTVILSGIAFAACGLGVLLTRIDFFKGAIEGRTTTYQKKANGQ